MTRFAPAPQRHPAPAAQAEPGWALGAVAACPG
jgi:hypothetical protein